MELDEILRQLKYDTQEIVFKVESIKNIEKQMESMIGKPSWQTRKECVDLLFEQIQDHKKWIDEYYLKMNDKWSSLKKTN